MTRQVLSKEQIDHFLKEGVLVVDNILSPSEVCQANKGLHCTLAEYGVDTNNLAKTGHALENLSSTNGSGGVLDLFYSEWKMLVASNSRLFHATCQLWEASYFHKGETLEGTWKWHPYGPFDCNRGYMYIDRIGYRIPTDLAVEIGCGTTKSSKKKPLQRSLTPHLDCCPDDFFSKTATKWRPIQCFVSLTDNLEPNTGGFEAVPGFHKKFHHWDRPKTVVVKKGGTAETFPAPCIGEYTHIRPREDRDVMEQIRHVPIRAGSAVFWDNRIPHANAYRNDGNTARAVVYCSFLPDVELNRAYVCQQLWNYQHNVPPNDQWINAEKHTGERGTKEDKTIETGKMTPLGRKLLGIDPW